MRRYEFYYRKFLAHEQSERKAKEGRYQTTLVKMNQMIEFHDIPLHEVEFLRDSYDEVIMSRETLKWTYAYIFYHELDMDFSTVSLFREWQSNLERHCEHMHEMVERPLETYLNQEADPERLQFTEFRQNLQVYTDATNKFRINIIKGIIEKEDEILTN